MNRRDFLSWLGIGAAVAVVDPQSLIADKKQPLESTALQVFKDYPKLYFTGLKPAMGQAVYAGQFLWTVDYVDEFDVTDRTYWYCNVHVDCEDLRDRVSDYKAFELPTGTYRTGDVIQIGKEVNVTPPLINEDERRRRIIHSRLKNGALTVQHMMDGIIEIAATGHIETGRYQSVPNPQFNPELPATTAWNDEDDELAYNPKMVNGPPILKKIKSMSFGMFDKSASQTDGWNIERLTDEVMIQLSRNWLPGRG